MPIYLGSKKLKCGYFGTVPLTKTMFGNDKVCSSSVYPPLPLNLPIQSDNKYKFIIYLKTADTLPAGYGPNDILDGGSSNGMSAWSFVHNDGDWYTLRCTSVVSKFYLKTDNHFTDAYVYRNAENNNNRRKIDMSNAFVNMKSLRTCKFSTNVGSILNFHNMFARNKAIEHVYFTYLQFGSAKNFHGVFYDCTNLKTVNYFDTQRGWQSKDGFDRFYMFEKCPSLVRPSSNETTDLDNFDWGGAMHYNVDAPYLNVKKYKTFKIIFTKTTNMDSYLTITEMKLFDQFGTYITAPNLTASSYYHTYVVTNLNDKLNTTPWHTNGPLPQWIEWEEQFACNLSEIRFGGRDNNIGRGPIEFTVYGKNATTGVYEVIKRITTRDWLESEERTFLIQQ